MHFFGTFFTQDMVFEVGYLKPEGGCLLGGVFQEESKSRGRRRDEGLRVLGFRAAGL